MYGIQVCKDCTLVRSHVDFDLACRLTHLPKHFLPSQAWTRSKLTVFSMHLLPEECCIPVLGLSAAGSASAALGELLAQLLQALPVHGPC